MKNDQENQKMADWKNNEGEEEACNCEEDEDLMVQLTLDDDSQLKCAVLSIFAVDDRQYIALLPIENQDRILLYGFVQREDQENPVIREIESDEEFDRAVEVFDQILQEEEAKANEAEGEGE